jgi:hypothetical protein
MIGRTLSHYELLSDQRTSGVPLTFGIYHAVAPCSNRHMERRRVRPVRPQR